MLTIPVAAWIWVPRAVGQQGLELRIQETAIHSYTLHLCPCQQRYRQLVGVPVQDTDFLFSI